MPTPLGPEPQWRTARGVEPRGRQPSPSVAKAPASWINRESYPDGARPSCRRVTRIGPARWTIARVGCGDLSPQVGRSVGSISEVRIVMRRAKELDVRRNEMLDVAQQLFYAEEHEPTSIRQITETIGIAKGTFYHYIRR